MAGQDRDFRQEEACTVWLHLCGASQEGPCGAVSDHETVQLDYAPRVKSRGKVYTGGVFTAVGHERRWRLGLGVALALWSARFGNRIGLVVKGRTKQCPEGSPGSNVF